MDRENLWCSVNTAAQTLMGCEGKQSRELDGDALASDVDGLDANGARLSDAIERVGVDLGVGGGVGAFAHSGDV